MRRNVYCRAVFPIGIFLCVLCFAGCFWWAITKDAERYRDAKQRAEENGRYCREAGMPAEANPFMGHMRFYWLEGWAESPQEENDER